jgi:hypothetical protein
LGLVRADGYEYRRECVLALIRGGGMNTPRMVVKVIILFVLFNILFALSNPVNLIGRISVYNWLVPGRARLPYGEDQRAYNLSLNSLPAMFASHEIARPKAPDEFRVVVIGDSSVWGVLLKPEQTLTAHINAAALTTASDQQVIAYNLGHPILSLTKDLLVLDMALLHNPDLIVWPVTLRSFPRDKQFVAPLVQNNTPALRRLFSMYALDYDLDDPQLVDPGFFERTIVGQRRPLADWLRLQLYGVMWGITGIDQVYPSEITLRTSNFEADLSWEGYAEPEPLSAADLSFDIIQAGYEHAGHIPLLLVNEPIFISDGANSDLRYNLWYPRWAYDTYRDLLSAEAERSAWNTIDVWDFIDNAEFTDSPVHLTPAGSRQFAARLVSEIERLTRGNNEYG